VAVAKEIEKHACCTEGFREMRIGDNDDNLISDVVTSFETEYEHTWKTSYNDHTTHIHTHTVDYTLCKARGRLM